MTTTPQNESLSSDLLHGKQISELKAEKKSEIEEMQKQLEVGRKAQMTSEQKIAAAEDKIRALHEEVTTLSDQSKEERRIREVETSRWNQEIQSARFRSEKSHLS